MKVSFTVGWWLIPIVVMWAWLAAMLLFERMDIRDVFEFLAPFLLVTVMCLLTRFLP